MQLLGQDSMQAEMIPRTNLEANEPA